MDKPQVMVALRDASAVEHLLPLACQMAAALDGDVLAMHVVQVPAATPLDAADEVLDREGKSILAAAARLASQRFSRKISTRLLRAREIGDAILGEARDRHADLLVMGQGSLAKLGEFLLGSTARHVARHTPCRVLVEILPRHHG
jgi:nucleotide-binding universal stress UspA family protein